MATTMYDVRDAVHVERWPSERPLFVLAVLVSLPIWLLLIVSVVGLIYAVLIGLFLFMGQASSSRTYAAVACASGRISSRSWTMPSSGCRRGLALSACPRRT